MIIFLYKIKNLFFILLYIFIILNCSAYALKDISNSSNTVKLTKGAVYIDPKILKEDSEKIIYDLTNILINYTIQKDYSRLPELISSEHGLFIDLKGYLGMEDLKNEIQKKNSYFEIFFFNRNLLAKEKKSSDVRTVRDLLFLAGELKMEYYYESSTAVEVKLKFRDNKTYENELNNLYFIKSGNKWFIHRLF